MLPLRSIRKTNSPCTLRRSEVMDCRSGQKFSMTTGLCRMSLWSRLCIMPTYTKRWPWVVLECQRQLQTSKTTRPKWLKTVATHNIGTHMKFTSHVDLEFMFLSLSNLVTLLHCVFWDLLSKTVLTSWQFKLQYVSLGHPDAGLPKFCPLSFSNKDTDHCRVETPHKSCSSRVALTQYIHHNLAI